MLLHYLSFEMVPARSSSMRIAIDGESPIVGDERFSSPRVPPKHTVLPEGNAYLPVPTRLYPVLLSGEGATLLCASARSASIEPREETGGSGSAWGPGRAELHAKGAHGGLGGQGHTGATRREAWRRGDRWAPEYALRRINIQHYNM
jgi:hypothetical protein